jgi:methyl-accepting chemotaxis protein
MATRDIGELIERVQEAVRETIAAMDNTLTEVGNGARLAGDTAKSLEEILLAAEGAAALASQIGGAVEQLRRKHENVVAAMEAVSAVVEENTAVSEEMATSSREVMDAMEGVAGVAEENSASAEEVSASAEEMSAQVEEVVASAQELSLMAEQLRAAVAQFRVEEVAPAQPREWAVRVPETVRSRQHTQVKSALIDYQGNGRNN